MFSQNKKKRLQWDSNHVPASYVALRANGCLHLRLLGTPVDERWVLWACKNKLCDPQRHSFHFELVAFQSVLTRLSYISVPKSSDGRTDGQTDGFSAGLYSTFSYIE